MCEGFILLRIMLTRTILLCRVVAVAVTNNLKEKL